MATSSDLLHNLQAEISRHRDRHDGQSPNTARRAASPSEGASSSTSPNRSRAQSHGRDNTDADRNMQIDISDKDANFGNDTRNQSKSDGTVTVKSSSNVSTGTIAISPVHRNEFNSRHSRQSTKSPGNGTGKDHEDATDVKCRDMLTRVKHFLQSLCKHCITISSLQAFLELRHARSSSAGSGAGQDAAHDVLLEPALELMRVLLDGKFCPHARAVFDYGDINGILTPLLSTLGLLMDPLVTNSGLEPMLWGNVLGLTTVLVEGNLEGLIILVEDVYTMLEYLNAEEENNLPLNLSCFQSLCKSAAIANGTQLEVQLGKRESIWHVKIQTYRLAGKLIAKFGSVLGAHPAFSKVTGEILDLLTEATSPSQTAPEPRHISGQIRIVSSLCIAAGDALEGLRACAPTLSTTLRKQLLELGRSWAWERVITRQTWASLASALERLPTSVFDRDDASLASESLRTLLCRDDGALSSSHDQRAMRSAVPFLCACIRIIESQSVHDVNLIRIVGWFANEQLLLDQSTHGNIARCLALGLSAVARQEAQARGDTVVKVCEELFAVTTEENKQPNQATQNPPSSERYLETIARNKRKASCLSTDTSAVSNLSPFVSPITYDAVVNTMQWFIAHASHLEPRNSTNQLLQVACTSVVLQALVQSNLELDTGHTCFRLTLQRVFKLFEILRLGHDDRIARSFLIRAGIDTGLALTYQLHIMQRSNEIEKAEHDALVSAVSGIQSIFAREDWMRAEIEGRATNVLGFSGNEQNSQDNISSLKVRFPINSLSDGLSRSLGDRFIILAGSFPCNWFFVDFCHSSQISLAQDFSKRCTAVFGARILNSSEPVRLFTIAQLPDLIRNFCFREEDVANYCDHLASLMASSQTSQNTDATQYDILSQATLGGQFASSTALSRASLQTLRGFLVKLGMWMSQPSSDIALEACTAAITEICQLRVVDPIAIETNPTAFKCRCHALNQNERALGDVRGGILLFYPWLHSVFFEALPNQSISSKARVAMLKCSIDIFRRVVHMAAWQGYETPLFMGRFPDMLIRILWLLEDPDQHVRQALAENISVFVEGCGGGMQFLNRSFQNTGSTVLEERFRVPEDALGRCDLLRAAFGYSSIQTYDVSHFMHILRQEYSPLQTNNVSQFMRILRRLISDTQRAQTLQLQQGILDLRDRLPITHTLLVGIGTIGCTADPTYSVENVEIGANLLSWALLMLTQQYAMALAWSNEMMRQMGEKGKRNFSDEDSRNCEIILSMQQNAAVKMREIIMEQFKRIAASHGFMQTAVRQPGQDGAKQSGVAIRRLFASMRKTLYPQLFIMLLSEPMVSKAPEALEDLLFEVFEYSIESTSSMVNDFTQSSIYSPEIHETYRFEYGEDASSFGVSGSNETEARAYFLSLFVKECLPDVLPEQLQPKMNIDVLYEIARRLYREPDAKREVIVKRLLIDHYHAWIVDLTQLLAQDSREDYGSADNSKKGYTAWRQILEFGSFSLLDIFKLSRKTILRQIVFRLVDKSGKPDDLVESTLGLLAEYAHRETETKLPLREKAHHEDDKSAPSSGVDAELLPMKANTSEDLTMALVRQEFMYLMSVLSERIGERWRSSSQRCHALRCAAVLLRKLGQNEIDPFLIKVLPTAKAALQDQDPEIQLLACDLMHELVNLLSDDALRDNLSIVVVSLLPCLQAQEDSEHEAEAVVDDSLHNKVEERAVETIHLLVVQKRRCLHKVFADIDELVPRRYPALVEVRKVLEEERGRATLLDRMRQLMKLIQHESVNVRLLALSELRIVIAENVSNLHKVLLDKSIVPWSEAHAEDELELDSNENDRKGAVTQLLSELIGTLLRLSRSRAAGGAHANDRATRRATRDLQLACGNCLGELGAIDPSRLDLEIVQSALSRGREVLVSRDRGQGAFSLDMGNEELAVYLIQVYLVDALRAAPDPNSHMQVGMAIQQLLRYFNKKGYELGEADSASSQLGSEASKQTITGLLGAPKMEIVKPFWDTNYTFVEQSIMDVKPRGRGGKCFFGPEVTFETSVGDWFAYLTKHTKGDQSIVFNALLVLCTYPGATDLLLFVLPYVVQNVLHHAHDSTSYPEDYQSIYTQVRLEIMEVFRDTWRGESCPGDDNAEADAKWLSGTVDADGHSNFDENSAQHSALPSSQVSSNSQSSSSRAQAHRDVSARIRRNAHVMFSLLDTLASWGKSMNIHLAASRARNTVESGTSTRTSTSSKSHAEYQGDFTVKKSIKNLLRCIPLRCLAEAAYRCGAAARALRYMESYMRRTHAYEERGGGVAPGAWLVTRRPVQFERDEITFLHRIYAALDQDPDGLLSVIAIRSRHDGGPGTGYVLGRTNHTVSSWPVSASPTEATRRKRNQTRGNQLFNNPELQAPDGIHVGDGGQPSLLERVLELEFSGRWDEAVGCYDRMLEGLRGALKVDTDTTRMEISGSLPKSKRARTTESTSQLSSPADVQVAARRMQLQQGRLSCLRRLNHLGLLISIGDIHRVTQDESSVVARPFCKEALWRLSRWADLKEVLNQDNGSGDDKKKGMPDEDLEVMLLNSGPGNMGSAYTDALARAMSALAESSNSQGLEGDEHVSQREFIKQVDRAKLQIMDFLSAVSTESYNRAYPLLLRLQALTELSAGWDIVHLAKRHRHRVVIGAAAKVNDLSLMKEDDEAGFTHDVSDVNEEGKEVKGHSLGVVTSGIGMSAFDLAASRAQIRRKLSERGWDDRFKITSPSVEMRRELFEVRRVVFELSGLRAEEMHGWLSLAKVTRLADDHQGCHDAIQRVQECARELLVAERRNLMQPQSTDTKQASIFESSKEEAEVAQLKAKLQLAMMHLQSNTSSFLSMLQNGNSGLKGGSAFHRALMVLEPVQESLDELRRAPPPAPSKLSKTRAKALLMATNLMVESGQGMGELVVNRYKAVLMQRPGWQQGHYYLARFFDYLLLKLEQEEDNLDKGPQSESTGGAGSALALSHNSDWKYRSRDSHELLTSVIRQYGKSLEHGGYEHIYESLPRLLTLWFTKIERMYPRVFEYWERDGGGKGRGGSRGKTKASQVGSGNSRSRSAASTAAVLLQQNKRDNSKSGDGEAKSDKKTIAGQFDRANSSVEDLAKRLPAYVWYTALPQLVSRIGVEIEDVWKVTKLILIQIAEAYPAQAFWHIMGVVKSNKSKHRRDRATNMCYEMLESKSVQGWVRVSGSSDKTELTMKSQFQQVSQIFDSLIKIATHKPRLLSEIKNSKGNRRAPVGDKRRETRLHIQDLFDVQKIQKRLQRCNIVVPTQSALTPTLPVAAKEKYRLRQTGTAPKGGARSMKARDSSAASAVSSVTSVEPNSTSHGQPSGSASSSVPQVFGRQCPMMSRLNPYADIMSSKAAPKKIRMYSHTEKAYNFLCKNEERGDLRKDARMMEFNTVVNRLFQHDPQARKRKLQLRTYAVVCLNESCGLLEWVENTMALRHVIQCVYNEENISTTLHEAWKEARIEQESLQRKERTLVEKVRRWEDKIVSKFPPLLHKWFINHFAEPEAWLEARSQFTRSCSAWSIVGHIVGLGDRHAENILINKVTGECVHVDFDCLFDKGLTLQIPEIVPFRLTPQMVDGMDLGGCDGGFRTNSEVCLQVLRTNKKMLMSVLESFVVDPLVEWKRVKQTQGGNAPMGGQGSDEVDQGKRAAQDKLSLISERLDGIMRERFSFDRGVRSSDGVFDLLPMSVQGQVHRLILEATDPAKLMSMYSGWAAFL